MPPKPWLRHYDAGVPASLLPYPQRTLLDYLADLARERPNHPAIIFKQRLVSYGELERTSGAFAAALIGLGVRRGDRVALLLPNCPQFLIAQFGIWKVGGIVVPINPIYTERELETALRAATPTTIVALTPFYDRVKAVQERSGLKHVIAASIKEYLPPLTRLLFTLFKERPGGHRVRLQAGDLRFAELLRQAPAELPSAGPGSDDPASVLLSGGTTGTPKGVVERHSAYVAAGKQLYEWGKSLSDPQGRDIHLLPLPLFHVYANVGIVPFAIFQGATLALVPNPRDLADLLRTIQRQRPTFFYGVPTLYTALVNHPAVRARKIDFSSIKLSFSGSSALMAETKRRWEELTGGRLVEGYSLTEAGMACTINPLTGVQKVGSAGLPLPDVDVLIVDADSPDREVSPGEVGEILLHAPQLMSGYWQNPEETALALRPHNGRIWLHTGDLGYLDEAGYLFIVDRLKDMIKTSGYQVWPREIEEVIATHPGVAEVGVAGVTHPTKGEVVKAWVVAREGAALTAQEVRDYCRQQLAPYKVPADIEFRTDLPKTMVGKVLRRALAGRE